MEPQHLFQVSLGKIVKSRGQRGGINLHKNLLVSQVLLKARTLCITETTSHQQAPVPVSVQSSQADEEDSTSSQPDLACRQKSVNQDLDDSGIEADIDEDEDDSILIKVSSEEPSVSPKSCSRCHKRRWATLEESDAQTQTESEEEPTVTCSSPTKRAKTTDASLDDEDVSSAREEEGESRTGDGLEPMQCDNVQISNLVNRFTGLLGSPRQESLDQSCSKQLKEGLPANSAIALAV